MASSTERHKRFWVQFEKSLRPFWDSRSDAIPDWDDYFHALALVASIRSKDERRKVGAVVVSSDRVVVATGFNGFPRGVKDLPERWTVQGEKLRWVSHAEANAIFNAARSGACLRDACIYVTTFPCASCAQAIVQAGISRVFTHGEYWYNDPKGYEKSIAVLSEAGVKIDAPEMRAKDHELRKLGNSHLKKVAANTGEVPRQKVRKAAKRKPVKRKRSR